MGRTGSLASVETDIKVNHTSYLSVRNVSTHSLLIRYRIVCGPALRLRGRTQNRAKMMTEVIAALIAPLWVCILKCRHFHRLMLKGYYPWPWQKVCLCSWHTFPEEQFLQGTVVQTEHAIRGHASTDRQSPIRHTGSSCILVSDGCLAAWQIDTSVRQGEVMSVF